MLFGTQHFGARGACWSFGMKLRRVTSINYSHGPTQNQTQGGQCIIGALLVLKRAMSKLELTGLTRLIKARTWGKPPPSPLQYTMCPSTKLTFKWHFVLGLPNGNPKITKVSISATLGPHNFVCRPSIEMRSEAKLQPLLRAFQLYFARHLHIRKSG